MPESLTVTKTAIDGNSASFVDTISITSESIERATPSVAAAKAGTLTTRTDDDTGTFTMTSGHGFATSDVLDVFWSGGSRTGMTATVTGDSVVLDGGSGDVLPIATTAVKVMKPYAVPMTVDGDAVAGIAVKSAASGDSYVRFLDAEDAVPLTYKIETANAGKHWVEGDGTNPLAELSVASVSFSHGEAEAKTMVAEVFVN